MLSGIELDIHSEIKKSLKIKHIHTKNEIRLFKRRNIRRRWNSNKRIKRGWRRINIKTKNYIDFCTSSLDTSPSCGAEATICFVIITSPIA